MVHLKLVTKYVNFNSSNSFAKTNIAKTTEQYKQTNEIAKTTEQK